MTYPGLLLEPVSKQAFLGCLQLEKRRAERTGTPLSIALFRPEPGSGDADFSRRRFVEMVGESKRVTDILATLADGSVAVLLLDTGCEGSAAFVGRIRSRAAALSFSSKTGTYPDEIFENIRANGEVPPEAESVWREEEQDSRAVAKSFKRTLDIVAASLGLLLLSPVMLGVAIAIAAMSPGPVIFRQVRLGRRGVPFVLYKFRSMVCDADDAIHRQHVTDLIRNGHDIQAMSPGKVWTKLESDPRITPVGRFIRKTSLDELPQLLNVVKGDLSLVGPRPPLPYEAAQYEAWHLRRILEMKPGITGLWQVEGADACTFNDMVRMDLQYLRQWSLLLDLKLIFKTIPVVALRKGAH